MRILVGLLLFVTGRVFAEPSYDVRMSLGIGDAEPQRFSMLVQEGRPGTISVSGERGFSVELTLTSLEANPKNSGRDHIQVQARIFDTRSGEPQLRGAPRMIVTPGRLASVEVRPADGTGNDDRSYYLDVVVSRFTGDLAQWEK